MNRLVTLVISGELDGLGRFKELIDKLDDLDLWIADNGYDISITFDSVEYKSEQPPEEFPDDGGAQS